MPPLLSTFENFKVVHKLGKDIVVGDYFGCPRYRHIPISERILDNKHWGWEDLSPKDAADRLKPEEWILVENIDVRYYKTYCNVDINNRAIKISGNDYYCVKTKRN